MKGRLRHDLARGRWTAIPNQTLRDERLSFRARGLLAELLSHDDGHPVDSSRLAERGREGRDAIRAALRELEDAGYLERSISGGIDGRWRTTITVRDLVDNPVDERVHNLPPTPENPASVSQALKSEDSIEERSSSSRVAA